MMGIPTIPLPLQIQDHLIFVRSIPQLARWYHYFETAPKAHFNMKTQFLPAE